MGLQELITRIGEHNIQVQCINTSFIKAKYKAMLEDTEVTFTTNQTTPDELQADSGKVGLIIWLPREEAEKHLK